MRRVNLRKLRAHMHRLAWLGGSSAASVALAMPVGAGEHASLRTVIECHNGYKDGDTPGAIVRGWICHQRWLPADRTGSENWGSKGRGTESTARSSLRRSDAQLR